jgi:DNA repair exonuclease SbcCD ATPase subunit
MSDNGSNVNRDIECPLCLGQGKLTRAEVLDRLGVKDLARVAQLSAEEAFRMLLQEHKNQENTLWLRFENELTKRMNEVTSKHKNEIEMLQTAKAALEVRLNEFQKNQEAVLRNAKQSERLDAEEQLQDELVALNTRIAELEALAKLHEQQKTAELEKLKAQLQGRLTTEEKENKDLSRKVEDYLKEITDLRAAKDALQLEMAKVARIGKREEINFAEEVATWPGIWLSEKLKRYGDYLLAYRDARGEPLEPKMVLDNKDKSSVTEDDVEKLIRDAGEQGAPVAALITKDESQLRTQDKEGRWASKDGVWILRTTRQWFHRDLDILKPLFETMRAEGADFLNKNSQLAEEVRRTFADIDEMEKELKKAAKAIESAKDLAAAYKNRLQQLCDLAIPKQIVARFELPQNVLSVAKK